MISDIERELAERGNCVIRTRGVSMEPLLHENRSSVVLVPAHHPLKKHDVVLFRREDGTKVLHRIVRVCDDRYVIRGDNCYGSETVPVKDVIGVMKSYYRDERDRPVACGSAKDKVNICICLLLRLAKYVKITVAVKVRKIICRFVRIVN